MNMYIKNNDVTRLIAYNRQLRNATQAAVLGNDCGSNKEMNMYGANMSR